MIYTRPQKSIEEMDAVTLIYWFSKFAMEVAKNSAGERYPPKTVYGIICGIRRLRLIVSNNIQVIFGIKTMFDLRSKPVRFSCECSLGIKVHACDPNMLNLLAVVLMNN